MTGPQSPGDPLPDPAAQDPVSRFADPNLLSARFESPTGPPPPTVGLPRSGRRVRLIVLSVLITLAIAVALLAMFIR